MIKNLFIILSLSILFQTVLGATVAKCLQCDSQSEANCMSDPSKIQSKTCPVVENTTYQFCLTEVDPKNGKVTRSCSATDCPSQDNCKSSDQNDGNTHNVCQTCDSSQDAKCAQSGDVESTFTKICASADTQCIININAKKTERRCATADDIKACTNEGTCKKCSGGNCNSGIFPSNRLRCYQCTEGQTGCNDVAGNSDGIKPKPCLFYDANDQCYVHGSSATTMVRGCVSDSTSNKCSDPTSNDLCALCKIDNCNEATYTVDQKLSCIQCTSSTTDDKCSWGQSTSDAKSCKNKIPYNKKGMCYTQTKDNVVKRGCFYDRETTDGECTTGNKCETCMETNGCNNKDNADYTCIICRSDQNPDCYDNADKINGTACREPVTSEEKGCFQGKWNGVVIRGCLVDADERVQATCKANTETCKYCPNKDCNIDKTSDATSLKAFAISFMLIFVLMMQKF